jgi:hypothetical protein
VEVEPFLPNGEWASKLYCADLYSDEGADFLRDPGRPMPVRGGSRKVGSTVTGRCIYCE